MKKIEIIKMSLNFYKLCIILYSSKCVCIHTEFCIIQHSYKLCIIYSPFKQMPAERLETSSFDVSTLHLKASDHSHDLDTAHFTRLLIKTGPLFNVVPSFKCIDPSFENILFHSSINSLPIHIFLNFLIFYLILYKYSICSFFLEFSFF